MWPIAIVLMAVVGFYWFSFMFTIWCWLQVIFCLCQLQFVRATIWFSLGSGMLFWWMGTDIDFDAWLHGSAVIVGLGALATFVRWCKKQQAMQTIPTDRKSTRLNSSHLGISYAVFCLKKKKNI